MSSLSRTPPSDAYDSYMDFHAPGAALPAGVGAAEEQRRTGPVFVAPTPQLTVVPDSPAGTASPTEAPGEAASTLTGASDTPGASVPAPPDRPAGHPLVIDDRFVCTYAPLYEVTDLEREVLEEDGPRNRKREYVKKKAFLRAGEWKSVATLRALTAVSAEDIEFMTAMALWKKTPDRYRLRILRTLDGVTVPMASALLAGVRPQRFPIMDARAVGVLFEADFVLTRNPAAIDYMEYTRVMRNLAEFCSCSLRDLYRALYAFDRLA
ncbi:hypothetical protein [Brevibacterium samyangense]|uniref:Uncharacterized protein n=1 Tax=Brevibacterium samyangense TaxID=366888 RepID=A0ABP5EK02_9MICO